MERDVKISECYLRLGEIGTENENYTGAIGDLLECQVLQKARFSPYRNGQDFIFHYISLSDKHDRLSIKILLKFPCMIINIKQILKYLPTINY